MMRCSIFTLLILVALTCSAQDSTQTDNRWGFLVEPYLMFPNMKGTLGVGVLPDGEVDAGIGDIFDRLQSGFMLYAEAQNGTWALSSDPSTVITEPAWGPAIRRVGRGLSPGPCICLRRHRRSGLSS
jgi:hypothetical protein